MDLLITIVLMILIGWVAIKALKVALWVVGILIVANLLSSAIGIVATIVVALIFLLSRKKITDGMLIFMCIAFLLSLV